MKVKGKTIVVTGGANGVGRELVLVLLDRGASVAAVDINEAALHETNELAGAMADRLSLHTLDITSREAVEDFPRKVVESHGAVDGLINNAGIIQPFVRVNNLEYKDIERVLNVNFYGTLYMIKAFLPYLLERPQAHILNVSSMGGFLPVPGQSIYGASKSAVKLLTEGLYAELSGTNVNVTITYPGAIATDIAANSGVNISMGDNSEGSKFKSLPANDAANQIIDAMERDKYRACIGPDAKFMDFIYRLSPRFANRFITRKMANLLGG